MEDSTKGLTLRVLVQRWRRRRARRNGMLTNDVEELLLRIRGLIFARAILERRGATEVELEEHQLEIERLRRRLASLIRGGPATPTRPPETSAPSSSARIETEQFESCPPRPNRPQQGTEVLVAFPPKGDSWARGRLAVDAPPFWGKPHGGRASELVSVPLDSEGLPARVRRVHSAGP